MGIQIRDEQKTDLQAIENLTKQAFLNAEHSSHTEHFIVNRLRNHGQLMVSRVAVENGIIVGHVAISPVTISSGARGWYGLGPISVLPEKQGMGIGSLLIHAALERLKQFDAQGCVVLGDPNYYSRFGFQTYPELYLADVPPAYFQAIAFHEPIPRGEVVYQEAFNAID
ncbi:GNAT family N-acetyltransferase [Acinetobacter sp. LoGeW2-3]|uniref:GNAT family N-acetyltransferase n=1 Tax=Acinetobacter sp. LoGeW2-3 TaxID=1808001 RepID=UPI000C058479|nr:N-acetyltransferase [Acinetobacter sp. LoGeW2-3]ATO18595.1 GNAT family N-acetyltransferase [Acinetobacter sp. LoGeW2-3]